MNSFIVTLNQLGGVLPQFAWRMAGQSSLLIGVIFALDLLLRRKARVGVRYVFWLIVLVKLLLPPTLALPTSLAWWLLPGKPPQPIHQAPKVIISYPDSEMPVPVEAVSPPLLPPPPPRLTLPAVMVAGCGIIACALLGWLIIRWFQISGVVRRARMPADDLRAALGETSRLAGIKSTVRLRVADREMSPAVCGLLQPVILLPQTLAENLPANQLRAVLLHELIHLRRRDVWINCLQTLLQIAYWWHPLVWFANARIRRTREEAVDDAVMLALNDEADCYAPTLLEVAKLAFHRPLASLGLVGILESRSALRQRIERLMDFQTPRRAGLSFVSILGIAAFTVLAVPMGEAPSSPNGIAPVAVNAPQVVVTNRAWAHADGFDWQIVNLNVPASVSTNEPPSVFVTEADPSTAKTNGIFITRRFHLDMEKLLTALGLPTNSLAVTNWPPDFKSRFLDYFKSQGVDLDSPTKTVFFKPDGNTWVRASAKDLDRLEAIIATNSLSKPDQIQAASLIQDGKLLFELGNNDEAEAKFKTALETEPQNATASYYLSLVQEARNRKAMQNSRTNGLRSVRNSLARTNLIYTSEARQAIMNKLDQIRLDSVSFDAMPLSEVVRYLSETAKRRDPDRRGINFLIYMGDSVPAKIDPATGLPIAQSSRQNKTDVLTVPVTINPPLSNPRLADALDAILKGASQPIKYAIHDYAVIFSLRGQEAAPLTSRRFKVDPNTFVSNLERICGLSLSILASGVVVPRLTATGSSITIEPQGGREGVVQRALITFFRSMGVKLDPPKSIFFNDREGTLWVRATTEDLDVIESAIQWMSTNDPQVEIHTKFINVPAELADKLWDKWLPASHSSTDVWSAVLSTEQMKTLVNDLHGNAGVQEIADGRLTTLSGRQTQFQVVDLPPPSVNSQPSSVVTLPHENASAIPLPLGPTLDTIAYVSADGYTIQMTVVPTLFLKAGIDESNSLIISAQASGVKTNGGALNTTLLPVPHSRSRQVMLSAVLLDGQTLAIHAPKQITLTATNGTQSTIELPLGSGSRQLILVTPRIIDSTGPVHSDEQLDSLPVIHR